MGHVWLGFGTCVCVCVCVCVCLSLQDLVQSCLHGVCVFLQVCVCLLLQDLVQSCLQGVCVCVFITAGPSTKLFTRGGGGDMGGHVLLCVTVSHGPPAYVRPATGVQDWQ
jgi:hypothetical protein